MYFPITEDLTTVRQITKQAQQQIKLQTGRQCTLLLCTSGTTTKTPHGLLHIIANALQMKSSCYKKKKRTRPLAELRFIATLLLRKHFPEVTLMQIGALFGGRDHTSVLYAYTRGRMLLSIGDIDFTHKYQTAQKHVNQWLQSAE